MKDKIKDELLDQLLENYSKPEDLTGPDGLLTELKRRLINRVMDAELTTHLGYDKHGKRIKPGGDARNGHSKKSLRSDDGKIEVKVPRDRDGDFEPVLVPKGQRHFDGFDDAIVSLYSRGLTVREIQEHLKEIYKVEVSPMLISNATDAVAEEVKAWQSRPLERLYPIVYFDAIVAKVRHEGKVSSRAIYLALAVNLEGRKEILGMWSSQNEGSRFWLGVFTELQNRGVSDILICCVDGLKGLPEAIESVFPLAKVQLCIVHMLRNSLKFVSWKERKAVAAQLKNVYNASSAEAAKAALDEFRETYDERLPAIGQSWESNWERVVPFFDYPPEIRKIIYTTNAIESLNSSFRKVSRHRNLFPTLDSLYKLFYLSAKNISKKWTHPVRDWPAALNRFTIEFGERITDNINK
ncbi:transposase, Mutator family [Verrucomicrobiia bacterium DG1235]|nr:transposase, Mutator family [Verrucomicrobiae bacterium DG1235]